MFDTFDYVKAVRSAAVVGISLCFSGICRKTTDEYKCGTAQFEGHLAATGTQAEIAEKIKTYKVEKFPVEGQSENIGPIDSKGHEVVKLLFPPVHSPFDGRSEQC